jgi:hypothetical protein
MLTTGVAATVYLQHCHSDDEKIRNEALSEYRTAIDFLTRASQHWTALKTAVSPPSQHLLTCSLKFCNNSNKTPRYGKL